MVPKIAVAAIVALVILVSAQDRNSTAADNSSLPWDQAIEQVDSFLQQGLSEDTHNRIADSLSSSAGVARGAAGNLKEKLESLRR